MTVANLRAWPTWLGLFMCGCVGVSQSGGSESPTTSAPATTAPDPDSAPSPPPLREATIVVADGKLWMAGQIVDGVREVTHPADFPQLRRKLAPDGRVNPEDQITLVLQSELNAGQARSLLDAIADSGYSRLRIEREGKPPVEVTAGDRPNHDGSTWVELDLTSFEPSVRWWSARDAPPDRSPSLELDLVDDRTSPVSRLDALLTQKPVPFSVAVVLASTESTRGFGEVLEAIAILKNHTALAAWPKLALQLLAPKSPKTLTPNAPSEPLGRLPPEQIQSIVRSRFDWFRHCYERELTKNPVFGGRIAVRFVITLDGMVDQVSVAMSTLANSTMEQCMVDAYSKLKFPPPAGGIVTVIYPISFTPG